MRRTTVVLRRRSVFLLLLLLLVPPRRHQRSQRRELLPMIRFDREHRVLEVPHVGRHRRFRRRVNRRKRRERRERRRRSGDVSAAPVRDESVVQQTGRSERRRTDPVETRALVSLGVVNRLLRRCGDPLVSGRAGEFLDDVSEVVLVDVVNGRLVLVEIPVVDLLLRLVISFLIHGGGGEGS